MKIPSVYSEIVMIIKMAWFELKKIKFMISFYKNKYVSPKKYEKKEYQPGTSGSVFRCVTSRGCEKRFVDDKKPPLIFFFEKILLTFVMLCVPYKTLPRETLKVHRHCIYCTNFKQWKMYSSLFISALPEKYLTNKIPYIPAYAYIWK